MATTPTTSALPSTPSRLLRYSGRARAAAPYLIALLLLLMAISIIHSELRHFRYHDVLMQVAAIPRSRVGWAVGLTAVAYAIFPCYDLLALRHVGQSIGVRRTIFASATSYAISQTLGFAALTGGSVRYRLWSAWGVESGVIARAIAFNAVTFLVGITSITAGLVLLEPTDAASLLRLPVWSVLSLGITLSCIVLSYLVTTWSRGGASISIRGYGFQVPRTRLAVWQVILPSIDWLAAAAVLYVLFPASETPGFLVFAVAFLLSQVAGLIAHVPGGVGVFEGVMLVVLRPYASADQILGTILVYRAIYYLLPFSIGAVALLIHESWHRRDQLSRVLSVAEQMSSALIPSVLAGAAFLSGVLLLASGATPAVGSRLVFLDRLLPLGVIELSHFVGSLAGTGLLILAWGLFRRLDAAWLGTAILLLLGILACFFKGLDWEEATALSAVLLFLLPARRRFTRQSALLSQPMTGEWLLAIGVVVACAGWLGVFAYKHVQYTPDLWWHVALRSDATRSMRAAVGSTGLLIVMGLSRLLRYAAHEPLSPTPIEVQQAAALAAHSADTMTWLAVLGDKSLMFAERAEGMLMYAVEGRSWIALGDPVGSPDACAELAWRFKEEAVSHGAWPVFYQAKAEHLPLYIDLGLSFMKVGEEGLVRLPGFTLDGGSRKNLRRTHRSVAKLGAEVEVVSAASVAAILPELKQVSDDWLNNKGTREKGFSLGRWDEDYLRHFPVAVVRMHGEIVAFSNMWIGAPGTEISVDLMRYSSRAPRDVMEYLFIEAMLYGAAQGFNWFSLGMAPMAGLADRSLAPLWSRAGSYLFAHGERFYNFEGLRNYKEKFDPVWRPRFIASPGGLALPRILTNVATLISGGVKGLVSK